MKQQLYLLAAVLLIGTILISSCGGPDSNHNPPTLTNSVTASQPTFTSTPNPTLTAIPTSTRTPKPTTTPTRVPLPTMPPAEALAKVQDLLETNGDCEFPCWWGITPEKTTWNEVLETLQPLAWKISDFKNHPEYKDKITREFYFAIDDQPTLINSLMAIFVLDRDTLAIEWIITANPYDLKNFFVDYDNPEEIWFHLTGIWTGPVEFTIKMFYPDKGIMGMISNYAERVSRNGEGFARICKKTLQNKTGGIVVWSPGKKKEFLDFFREYEETYRYKPVNEVLGMSPEEFTRFILEAEGDQCLETPLSLWEE